MKTITLTVDVVCEIEDNVNPSEVYLDLPSEMIVCKDYVQVGEVKHFETTGFFEEEKLGLSEFEDKPETD